MRIVIKYRKLINFIDFIFTLSLLPFIKHRLWNCVVVFTLGQISVWDIISIYSRLLSVYCANSAIWRSPATLLRFGVQSYANKLA